MGLGAERKLHRTRRNRRSIRIESNWQRELERNKIPYSVRPVILNSGQGWDTREQTAHQAKICGDYRSRPLHSEAAVTGDFPVEGQHGLGHPAQNAGGYERLGW
ncbi:hypothetical protein D3C73_1295870 [compost metagenome]